MSSENTFIENQLKDNESILYSVKPTMRVVPVAGAAFIAIFILWLLVLAFANMAAFAFAIFVIIAFFAVPALYLYVIGSEFAVTEERIIGKVGIIGRSTFEIPIQQGEGLIVHQDIIGRIFDYGSIQKSGTGGAKAGIYFIPSPWDVRKKLNEFIEKAE